MVCTLFGSEINKINKYLIKRPPSELTIASWSYKRVTLFKRNTHFPTFYMFNELFADTDELFTHVVIL